MNVARQVSEPAFAEARPEERADRSDHQAGTDDKFSKFGHGVDWLNCQMS